MSRPLILHVSALNDAEYTTYTAIIRDIVKLDHKHAPDYDKLAVGTREARAWLRSRYPTIASYMLDSILRLFAPYLGPVPDVLSGGQFFAALRLVAHVLSGRDMDPSLVFVQAIEGLDTLGTPFGQANTERKERATKLNARQSEARRNNFYAGTRKVYDLLWNNESLSISEEHEGVRYIAPQFSFDTRAPIMIRDEYDELWQQTLLRLTQNCTGDVHGMVIVGQPGIGKSLFLVYAFARALQAGIPTVLCKTHDLYCIANDEGITVVESGLDVPLTPNTLVLIDIIGPNPPPELLVVPVVNPGFVVQATSPEEVGWRSWSKQRGAVAWVMSTWTREEISSLQKLRESLGKAPWTQNKDSWYTPLELYELLGPSARSCFQLRKPKTATTLGANLLSHPLNEAIDRPLFYDTKVMVQHSSFHDFFFATPDENLSRPTLHPFLKYEIPTPFLRLSIASHYRQYVEKFWLKTRRRGRYD